MARVDSSGGKRGEDTANRDLYGEAVFNRWQFEWRCSRYILCGKRRGRECGGFVLREVVITEVLVGQGGAAATASAGADVSAEFVYGYPSRMVYGDALFAMA